MSAEQKRHSDVFVNQNPNAGSDAAPPLLVAILDEFASDRRPLLVYPYEIVARTGANKGAVYRAFKQGVESGWLVRSAHAATDAYRLGPKAVRLLQHWIDQSLYEADRCGAVVAEASAAIRTINAQFAEALTPRAPAPPSHAIPTPQGDAA